MNTRTADAAQGLCVLLGITFGLIPLGQRVFGAEQGFLFRAVAGDVGDPAAWLVPAVVLTVLVAVITGLERAKR